MRCDERPSPSSEGTRPFLTGVQATWRYASADKPGVIEYAWSGPGSRRLRPHFHDEIQITIVLAGRRAFCIDGEVVTLSAGQGIVIPAGKVHAPIAGPDDETGCVNFYVEERVGSPVRANDILPSPPSGVLPSDILLRRALDRVYCVHPRTVMGDDRGDLRSVLAVSGRRIGEIAAEFHCSREGFSRRAKRELHIAPHGYRIISRLNRARRLLRDGQSAAAAAAEAGFSDQSHLTRLFRETFGTTPGLYRRG